MSDKINFDDIQPRGCDEIPMGEIHKKNSLPITMESVPVEVKPTILIVGVDELTDVAVAGSSFANAIHNALADDGKVTLSDAGKFIGPMLKLPAAIGGIGQVPAELENLTDEEMQQISNAITEELQVSEHAEEITKRSLAIMFEIKKLVDLVAKAKTA